MKRDIFFSITVHLVILFSALITSPFEPTSKTDYGEVIQVSLKSADQLSAKIEELPPEPVKIPKPVVEEEPDIPISPPETKPPAKIEEPKKKEPEPTKEKKEPRKTPAPEEATRSDQDQADDESSEVDLDAASVGGGVLSGATIGNATFNYPYWNGLAFPKISRNFRNPVNYDGTLSCIVQFEVMQSGRVYSIAVRQSSGIPQFDRACMAAVERSAPLPPLPREFLAEVIDVTLTFEWEPE